ncbi:uncharacterized protein RHOBADRAFT_51870 [Rhodotorula graminis WP1]|uniref:peptidylprolyl isomerase n=1 Tax=Rhodotorula graminis (strain WP1) TaxID=578459 RepID=A0A194S8T5_RHOGW|nr:uncharacterized protein RHOBADRAFT_51870 [Rhodotorula graminis WP1]KPV76885.1 hypothetical protein RHOBADRAFT_51870 [Rhodotorula graminis WP1]
MSGRRCFIDFAAGDADAHKVELSRYQALARWLEASGAKYGLARRLDELDDAARETLVAVYEGETQIVLTPADLSPPTSLLLPRLYLQVSSSPGLKKTSASFLALLTDEKKLVSKRAPHPPLRYRGTPVFRLDKGFVAQTGDVTRQDGSGGESIYGGTFNDEKDGLKIPFQLGTVAMANSGKNSNTSQFFVTLTSDPVKLKKLTGKYVAFGQVDLEDDGSRACLERLDALADGRDGTAVKVWIDDCNAVA